MQIFEKILFVYMALQWGGSYIAIEIISHEVAPFTAALIRVGISLLVMTFVTIFQKQKPSTGRLLSKRSAIFKSMLLGLFSMALPWTFLFWGEKFVAPSLASLLSSTTPIFAFVLTSLLEKKIPDRIKTLSVLTGFFGVLLVLSPTITSQDLRENALPTLAVLAPSFSYAIATIGFKKIAHEISVPTAHFFQSLGAFLFLFPFALTLDPPPQHFTIETLSALIFLGVGSSCLAWLAMLYLTKIQGPVASSYVSYFIPPISLLLEGIFYHQLPSSLTLLGGGMIFLSLSFFHQARNKPFTAHKAFCISCRSLGARIIALRFGKII